MNELRLDRRTTIYYDLNKKIIGRKPTNSNMYENGSDNSLYMGLITNDKSKELLCQLFLVDDIKDFSNKTFFMHFYDDFIEIKTNINDGGQLQFKIIGNGKMYSMLQKYQEIVHHEVKISDLTIYLNFSDNEIYFIDNGYYFEYNINEKNKIKEDISTTINEINQMEYKEYDNNENYDAYVEAAITRRNQNIQAKFRNNLIMEFGCKCALCDINKKELLKASHILPYSKCSTVEQMIDHNNGILLCPNHDILFDRNFITFNSKNGKIQIVNNDILNSNLYNALNINTQQKLNDKILTTKRQWYLDKHKIKV